MKHSMAVCAHQRGVGYPRRLPLSVSRNRNGMMAFDEAITNFAIHGFKVEPTDAALHCPRLPRPSLRLVNKFWVSLSDSMQAICFPPFWKLIHVFVN